MPIVGVHCADPKFRRAHVKKEIPLQDCLNCAATRENPCQFTYEMLRSMFDEQQDRGERISTTTLTGKCLRSEFLKRKGEFHESPEKLWPAFRGTMFHGQLEYQAPPWCIAEARYKVHIEDLGEFTGSPDLVDPRAGKLYDYKTTKEVPRFDYPWEDHANQVQVNRWLVDHATSVEWQGEEYDLTVMENRARFVPHTWTELVLVYIDDKGPKPITCTKSVEVPAKAAGRTKRARVPDIWPDDEAEDFIVTRYRAAKKALVGEGELPDVPDYMLDFNHPLCGFCAMKQQCMSLHFGQEVA